MAGIAGGPRPPTAVPSEHSCSGVCPGANRTGQSRAASAEQILLGRGQASRPSGPGAPALLEVGGAGLRLAHTGLHPDRGLDRASTFTGLQAGDPDVSVGLK